ncbi:uncharacterized protein LOC124286246 [Haliotis rubra]|uniref:uncharacterized protein LOC124286246 n=1 Tax=Haliotis rubra TaxID=36100 RepID=UPI001EE626B3|nr:uncharacterized protein LOC124286246 [Haliotis rubra]
MLLTLILLGVSTSAASLAFKDESQYGASDVVDPVLIHSAHIRHERSAKHMPDVLHFRFELSGAEVSLNLTRSERDIESYPVYLTDERGPVLQTDLPQHENTAVYRNSAQGSAAIITRKTEDVYLLAGTIHLNNQTYKISPKKHHVDKRQASTSRNQHELREIVSFSMNNDTAFPSLEQGIPSNVQGIPSNAQGMSNDHTHYTIELALFPDFSDYTGFLRAADGNTTVTISNMRLYYAFVEEMMQVRYDTVNEQDPSISITVWIKYIDIATSVVGSPWTETTKNGSVVPAVPALLNHARYLLANAPRSADAYMIFTRTLLFIEAMHKDRLPSFSEKRRMCIICFLQAAEGNSTVTISNMRLYYAFVEEMSAAGSPWTETIKNGSEVSPIQALNNHAEYLSVNAPRSADAYMIFTRYALGVAPYENGTNFELMCRIGYCMAPGNLCFGFIPLDQTSCGDKKWCERGACVYNAAAPPKSAKCPQRDDPAYVCEAASCTTYSPFRLLTCCATCAAQILQKTTTVRFIVLRTAPPILFFG